MKTIIFKHARHAVRISILATYLTLSIILAYWACEYVSPKSKGIAVLLTFELVYCILLLLNHFLLWRILRGRIVVIIDFLELILSAALIFKYI